MLKWFSVYIGLSEGIELITEDQRAEKSDVKYEKITKTKTKVKNRDIP